MRAAVLLIALAACTPDVFSETYYCGPDSLCPEGQACNGPDNVCVNAASAEAFKCDDMSLKTEPDDTAAQAHALLAVDCGGIPFPNKNCMLDGNDAEDWVRLQQTCTGAHQLEAFVSFPEAFERLAIELWDLDTMTKLADDTACTKGGAAGEESRCISHPVVEGANYGIKVHPAGDGNCDGNCPYNRYTLSVALPRP